MFVKIYPKDIVFWQAFSVSSEARFWNPFNFSSLYSADSKGIILNLNIIAKQLEACFNFLSLVYSTGGRAWFYNLFIHPQRVLRNGSLVFRPTMRFRFGVSLLTWFPGRLSNFRFLRKLKLFAFARLFNSRASSRLKSNRYRYIVGSRKNRNIYRRNHLAPNFWERKDPEWEPKVASRRRGIDQTVLRKAILRFKNLTDSHYLGLRFRYFYLLKKEKKTFNFFLHGRNRALSYYYDRMDTSSVRRTIAKLRKFERIMDKQKEFTTKLYSNIEQIRDARSIVRSFRYLRSHRMQRKLRRLTLDKLTSLYLNHRTAKREINLLSFKISRLRAKFSKHSHKMFTIRKRPISYAEVPKELARPGKTLNLRSFFIAIHDESRRCKRTALTIRDKSRRLRRAIVLKNGQIKLKPKRRSLGFYRALTKNLLRLNFKTRYSRNVVKPPSEFLVSEVFFSEQDTSLFSKPDIARSFSIYKSFVSAVPAEEVLLRGPIKAGTPENPTNLPVTNMPTTNPRRLERIKKKLAPAPTFYNTREAEDFKFLVSSNSSRKRTKGLEQKEEEEKSGVHHPFMRYARIMLRKSYSVSLDNLNRRYLKRIFDRIDNKFLKRDAWIHKKSVPRKFPKKNRRYRPRLKWFKKLNLFTDKLYRLSLGLPFLTFRGLTFSAPFIDTSIFTGAAYNNILKTFYTSLKFRSSNFRLLTFNNIKKPRKTVIKNFRKRAKNKGFIKEFKSKPKSGHLIKGEKVFKRLNSLNFNKFKKNFYTPKRKALLLTLLNPNLLNVKVAKNFTFKPNFLSVIRRRKSSFSGRYLQSEKFYSIKNSPTINVTLNNIKPKIFKTNSIFFTDKLSLKETKRVDFMSKDSKAIRIPHSHFGAPRFIFRKFLKKAYIKAKKSRSLKVRFKLKPRNFKFFPSVIFFSNLSRLTLSIIGEAKAAGVCSAFFSSGEAAPFATFNIIINDYIKDLNYLKYTYRKLYKRAKVYTLLARL